MEPRREKLTLALFVYDHCDQLDDFIGLVGNAVASIGRADGDIACGNGLDRAVVAVLGRALENIEKLRVTFVDMIADTASRIQSDLGKKPALAAELLGTGDEICELDGSVAVTHMFAVLNLTFAAFADHRKTSHSE